MEEFAISTGLFTLLRSNLYSSSNELPTAVFFFFFNSNHLRLKMREPKGCIPQVLSAFLLGQFSEIILTFVHFVKEIFLAVLLSSIHPAI